MRHSGTIKHWLWKADDILLIWKGYNIKRNKNDKNNSMNNRILFLMIILNNDNNKRQKYIATNRHVCEL